MLSAFLQASDFTNVGDWPTLGKGATPTTPTTPGTTNESGSTTEAPKKTTEPTPKPGPKPTKSAEVKKTETKAPVEKPANKPVSPPKKPSTAAPPKSGAVVAKSSGPVESSPNQNGALSNGAAANTSNGSNRRVPKSKWVPLEIEVPKARTKGRERNNNVNSKRRERPGENEERPRRTRNSSIRSTGSTARSLGASGANRVTAGSGRTTAPPGKRSGTIRTAGGIQKPRYRNQNTEFTLDYPLDFSLVKKIVASGAAGVDGASPFLMPYMGTFYYNGVPSYAKMDPSSLKEAIKKQMYVYRPCWSVHPDASQLSMLAYK